MRTNMSKAVVGLASLLICAAAHATPSSFSVQGVLRDNAGALQSAMVPITVKIFNDQTASDPANLLGTPIASQAVMAENGLFTVAVPVDASLQALLVSTTQPWLELTAGADIFPRQPLSADVYALIAKDSMSLGGIAAADYLTEAEASSTYLTQTAATATYQPLLKTTNCTVGKYIQAIDAAGNVTCANDANSGGTVTNVTSTSNALTVSTGTTTPSLTVNGANITGLSGANVTAGTIPKTALATGSLSHTHVETRVTSSDVLAQVAGGPIRFGNCASCPGGTVLVGGNCYVDDSNQDVVLHRFFISGGTNWCCDWRNPTTSPRTAVVSANCLSVGTTTLP